MSHLANILHRSEGMIRFQVDDVEICPTLVPTRSARSQLEERFKTPLILFSHDDSFQGIQTAIDHPLVTAVHLAFSEHRPLVLTPDSIWMTISQGLAQHINNNVDAFRFHFVKHSGKIQLEAFIEDTRVRQQWEDAIDVWTNKIRQQIGEEVYSLMVCDFSTTTPTIRTASHIVMMDAFREYFDYILYGISSEFPTGLSRAPFTLQFKQFKNKKFALELIAGFIGITQDSRDGCLQLEIGWFVSEPDTFSKLLAQLQGKEHKLQSPIKDLSRVKPLIQMPKEFVQLLENFDGGTLFAESEHPWKIRSLRNYTRYEELGVCLSFHGFIDLKDDRCIAFGYTSRIANQRLKTRYEWWVVVGQTISQGKDLFGQERRAFKPEGTQVIATNMTQFFERILQAEGRYYFDDPEFVPERSLL
ncbi:MAG: DUF4419 domain-containing protein [Cyanobacteriota bacterium]|nr:DUF4419 domain-containing protein [Cyanobacteriota bacterium]